jgi:hypothetical protein
MSLKDYLARAPYLQQNLIQDDLLQGIGELFDRFWPLIDLRAIDV